jgi:hypothetical protein
MSNNSNNDYVDDLFQILLNDAINVNNLINSNLNNYDASVNAGFNNNTMLNNNNMFNNNIGFNNNIWFNNNTGFIINELINYNANDNNNDDMPPLIPINNFYENELTESQTVLNESLYDRNPIRHVITDDIKNSLIPIKFKHLEDKENNNKCSITMDPFNDDDDIIQLPCSHCFLVEPIMQWLTEENCVCPICRYCFESTEKKTLSDAISDVVSESESNVDMDISDDEMQPNNNLLLNGHNMMFSQLIHNLLSDDEYYENIPMSNIGPPSTSPDLCID